MHSVPTFPGCSGSAHNLGSMGVLCINSSMSSMLPDWLDIGWIFPTAQMEKVELNSSRLTLSTNHQVLLPLRTGITL
ncbi:hypothetical protein Y032_0065g3639 [Ancylostoma ceylanicum]|uniref:Uncharacterized protein n=1 Tax=Ancylostoma ceylanicum TaxID=53326 RepID=A0A016U184_9BILA|nr:hypothetical protein Y032_0065g3639 [Ancylostoma ceylanicum]